MIKLGLGIRKKLNMCKRLCNNLIPIMMPYKKGINENKREQKIVVSLTSYPQRFNGIHLTIKSILHQTCKPDKIVLYLDEELKKVDLPKKLKKLEKYGLQIEYRPYDIKPHKKYYFAILEHPNDIVITIDDDMIYEKTLIENLYNSFKKYPNCISAKRVHKMKKNKKYNQWEHEVSNVVVPSHELVATGVGGVLYPPKVLPEEAFDMESITKYCLGADDIWLKFMELKNDIKVVYVQGRRIHPIEIWNSQTGRLNAENVGKGKNDEYIKLLEKLLNISLEDYCK